MPSFLGGLLGDEEEYRRLQQQAQSSSLGDMASAFYKAGAPSRFPGGSTLQAINEGMMAQEGGYKRSMNEQLQEKIAQQKMRQEMMAREQQTKAQGLLPQLMGRAVRPETPLMDNYGVEQAGPNMPRSAQMNEDVLNKLLMNPGGQSVLKNFMDAKKATSGETFNLGLGEKRFTIDPFTNQTSQVAAGDEKPQTPDLSTAFKQAINMLGLPLKDANLYTNEERLGINKQIAENAKGNRASVTVNAEQRGFQNTSDLKKQFAGEPIYKAFEDMKLSFGQVAASINAGTPVGDLAGATKIMKLLDPGSVVRESELGMAMAAGGRMDRLKNYFQQAIDGTKLTPTQRGDFQSLAGELYNVAANSYNSKRAEYSELGQAYDLNSELALGKPAKIQGEIKRIGW